jgi:signal transduction histidine kinase/ActR/RegA family two-component response regulator
MHYYATGQEIEGVERALSTASGWDRSNLEMTLAWYLREAEPARARSLADAALAPLAVREQPEAVTTVRLRARAALLEGDWAMNDGESGVAAAACARGLAAFERIGDSEGVADANFLAFYLASQAGDAKPEMHLEAARQVGGDAGPPRRSYPIILKAHLLATGDPDGALRLIDEASRLEDADHPAVAMQVGRIRFRMALHRGEASQQIAPIRGAYEQALACRAFRWAAQFAINLADASRFLGDLESALEWGQVAVDLARPRGFWEKLGNALGSMGATLVDLKRPREAWALFEDAMRVWPASVRNSLNWAVLQTQASEAARDLGDSQRALACLREAQLIALRVPAARDVAAAAQCVQVSVLSDLGQVDDAIAVALQVLDDPREAGFQRHCRSLTLRGLAGVARRHGLPLPADSAAPNATVHYLEAALEQANLSDIRVQLAEWLSEASQEYELAGDPIRALAMERRAVQARAAQATRKANQLATSLQVRLETERARADAEHQRALAAAEARRADAEAAANRAKSAFLANMSHELRSPLNAMLGFSRLLLREPGLPERARHDVAIVLRSGEQLYALINQVLEMSKIEAGRLTLQLVPCDLDALLSQLKEMFTLAARDKGLALSIESEPATPRHVRADAVKLRQVLVNLLGNAIKFTERGSVTLRAEAVGATRIGFSVSDTGVGISDEDLRALGQAFMQAQAGRQFAEGTGLGLAISRAFVGLMGGELELRSQPGQGTTASFVVDVGEITAPEAAAEPLSRRVVRLASGTPAPRILVADDRAEGRELLVRLLSTIGFEVREAADGRETVETWQRWRPHLVCMDMRMPVVDGREATRRIKALPGGRETVIIAITASSFEEQREEILAAGCDDFLRKPFQEERLLQMLAGHLGIRYEHETPPGTAELGPVDVEGRLAALPIALRDRLLEALGRLDVHAVEQAVETLRDHDAAAAAAVAPFIERFEYPRLAEMLGGRPAS